VKVHPYPDVLANNFKLQESPNKIALGGKAYLKSKDGYFFVAQCNVRNNIAPDVAAADHADTCSSSAH